MKVGDIVRDKYGNGIGYITANTFWGGDSVWVRWINIDERPPDHLRGDREETQEYKAQLRLVET